MRPRLDRLGVAGGFAKGARRHVELVFEPGGKVGEAAEAEVVGYFFDRHRGGAEHLATVGASALVEILLRSLAHFLAKDAHELAHAQADLGRDRAFTETPGKREGVQPLQGGYDTRIRDAHAREAETKRAERAG